LVETAMKNTKTNLLCQHVVILLSLFLMASCQPSVLDNYGELTIKVGLAESRSTSILHGDISDSILEFLPEHDGGIELGSWQREGKSVILTYPLKKDTDPLVCISKVLGKLSRMRGKGYKDDLKLRSISWESADTQ
jgi:hypothetical protein